MITRSGYLLSKIGLRLLPYRKDFDKPVPVPELLAQMDAYDWTSVEDIAINENERRDSEGRLREIIQTSGLELDGSVLDLASGAVSLASSYPDTVAVEARIHSLIRRIEHFAPA